MIKNVNNIMHGLVSLLDSQHYKLVENIWRDLEINFGLTGIKVTPFPHFSWQVAGDYEWDVIEEKMLEASEKFAPFTINTAGLGIFTGENPIIFISVLKNLELIKLHKTIFEIVKPSSKEIVPYYYPSVWIPHISLAYSDVSEENIGLVMKYLSFRNYDWKIMIDNVALIYEPTGSIGKLKHKFKFIG